MGSMPLFLRNGGLAFLLYSGWRERSRLPSNATLAYQQKKGSDNRSVYIQKGLTLCPTGVLCTPYHGDG